MADTGVSALSEPTRVDRHLPAFIGETVDAAGTDGVVVGLEAGLGSAVAATLAVVTLHRHSVYGSALPGEGTPESAIGDARSVANSLGIAYRIVEAPSSDRWAEYAGEADHAGRPESVDAILRSPTEGDRSTAETAARLDLEPAVAARYGDTIDRAGREPAPPNALGDRWSLTGGEGR